MTPVAKSPTAPPPPSLLENGKATSRKRFEAFHAIFRDDILDDFRKHNMDEKVIEYYRRVRPLSFFVPSARRPYTLIELRIQRPGRKA